MIKLTSTKNQGFTISPKYIFLEKPEGWGGGGGGGQFVPAPSCRNPRDPVTILICGREKMSKIK